jgi:hypothetical protein
MNDIERKIFKYITVLTFALFAFSFYFWGIDPVIRPVLEFRHYDQQNIQLTKSTYEPGEMVYGYASFCKKRKASGTTQWTLANEKLVVFTPNSISQVPAGSCYPEVEYNENGEPKFFIFPIKQIPLDAINGEHYFVGVTDHMLSLGRKTQQSFKTETFQVINSNF